MQNLTVFQGAHKFDHVLQAKVRAQRLQFLAAHAIAYRYATEAETALLKQGAAFEQQAKVLHLHMSRHADDERDVLRRKRSLDWLEVLRVNATGNDAQALARHPKTLDNVPGIGLRDGDHEPRRCRTSRKI